MCLSGHIEEQNLRVGILSSKNLLELGYKKQATFSFKPYAAGG